MEWEENALTPTHSLQHAILCSLMILGLILLDDTQASFNEWLSQNAVYLAFALAGFILLCVLLLLFIPVAKKKKKSKKAVIAKTHTSDRLTLVIRGNAEEVEKTLFGENSTKVDR